MFDLRIELKKVALKVQEILYKLGLIADYAVEAGTNGIWTYKKYNSGLAKCWGTTESVATGSLTKSNYIYYKSGIKVATLPTDLFIEVDTVIGSQNSQNTVGWLASIRHNDGDIIAVYDREQSGGTNLVLSVEVKGKWKSVSGGGAS